MILTRLAVKFNVAFDGRVWRARGAWGSSRRRRRFGYSWQVQVGTHTHLNLSWLWGWEWCSYIRVWQLGLGFATVRLWRERD